MKYHSNKLGNSLGAAALACMLAAPVNAAIVLGGEDGWQVSYGGFINLFYTQSKFEYIDNGEITILKEDSAHLNEGLLPAFHTMTVTSPETNGLKGTAQITFAVDSSSEKFARQNKGGGDIDMREVFFNVEGDFGTLSAGRTLSLFLRQDILKDYTLFGVGALSGPNRGGTSLGRIGFGYVYMDFRTRFAYQTPDMDGLQLSVGIFDPQEPAAIDQMTLGLAYKAETDIPQLQAEAVYKGDFEGGDFSVWSSFMWQEMDILISTMGGTGNVESVGYNIGAEINASGFNFSGHYYGGKALGTLLYNVGGGNGFDCNAVTCTAADNSGYYIQGGYKFKGTTLLGITYGKSEQDADAINPEVKNKMWTVGVYHDINSWLKVIAEYSDYQSTQLGFKDVDTFSVGGFITW